MLGTGSTASRVLRPPCLAGSENLAPCSLQGILHPGPPPDSFGDLGVPATPRPVHRPAQGTSSFWLSLSSSTHSSCLKPYTQPSISGHVLRVSGPANHCDTHSVCHPHNSLPAILSPLFRFLQGPPFFPFAFSVRWLFLEPCWASNSGTGTGTGQKRFQIHS